jgi:hypothetical protein
MSFEKALVEEIEKVIPNVFPLVAPEGTPTPYCVYVSSYGEREYTLSGYIASREIEVEIHVVGKTYAEMKPYMNGIIDKLITFEGKKMGTAQLSVQSVQYDKPHEMSDPETYEAHSFTDFTFRL